MDMNVNLKQSGQLSQQLNLAPQLLHWLRLLQVPAMELSQLVRAELEQNPALEEGPDPADAPTAAELEPSVGEGIEPTAETDFDDGQLGQKLEALAEIDDEWRSEYLSGGESDAGSTSDEQERHQFLLDSYTRTSSIQELLFQQLGLLKLSENERVLAELIIGSLDGNGYLTATLDDLAQTAGLPVEDPEGVLRRIQAMGPAGVAARDLRECLGLQLESGEDDRVAREIVDQYLEALAREQYGEIAAALSVPVRDVMKAKQRVASLNPYPGRTEMPEEHQYVTPDVEIRLANGELHVELCNGHIPHLRLSSSCRRMLESGGLSPADMAYIRNKIRSASFLIQGIRRRDDTLRRVAEQIAGFQGEYLRSGHGSLKPLTMAKIASILHVHETTVSRALANKYVKTPRGVLALKHFFQPGYRCVDGSAMTPEAVKVLMDEIIAAEDPACPVRDVDIAAALRKRGLVLARRTIAKYREELGISSSKQRRQARVAGSKMRSPAADLMPICTVSTTPILMDTDRTVIVPAPSSRRAVAVA